MDTRRAATALALAAAAAGAALGSAVPANATSIVGAGNSAHDNACSNAGSASQTTGPTTHAPGIVSSLAAAVPVSNPGNQCGDLGVPSMFDLVMREPADEVN